MSDIRMFHLYVEEQLVPSRRHGRGGDNMSPNKGTQRITPRKEYGKRSPGLIYVEQVRLKVHTICHQTKEHRESLPKKDMGKGFCTFSSDICE